MKQQLPKRHYTQEFKGQAVQLAHAIGRHKAAHQLDVPISSLDNWLTLINAGKALSTSKRSASVALDSELSRLRAENALLKMERDILKKAAAYFAMELK